MTCASCGTENPAGARFCMSCGAALERRCPSCGTPAPPEARFCMTCGSALDAEAGTVAPRGPAGAAAPFPPARGPEAVSIPPEERRQVTVLFADLSGYTAFAERMDPETVKSLVDRALLRLGQEVELRLSEHPSAPSVRTGRCLPYGSGIVFWALGEVLRAECGIVETDSSERAWQKLRLYVADLMGGQASTHSDRE